MDSFSRQIEREFNALDQALRPAIDNPTKITEVMASPAVRKFVHTHVPPPDQIREDEHGAIMSWDQDRKRVNMLIDRITDLSMVMVTSENQPVLNVVTFPNSVSASCVVALSDFTERGRFLLKYSREGRLKDAALDLAPQAEEAQEIEIYELDTLLEELYPRELVQSSEPLLRKGVLQRLLVDFTFAKKRNTARVLLHSVEIPMRGPNVRRVTHLNHPDRSKIVELARPLINITSADVIAKIKRTLGAQFSS